jgi:xanthine dehydrogenase small subunit
MKSPVSQITVERARSLDAALKLLQGEALVPIAGATDLYVGLNFGTLKSRRFLDITAIEELRGVREEKGKLVIGAGTTYSDIMRSALVKERLPILAEASSQVGGVQIQNRGTLGGNIANGSPAGDSLPVLAVAEAILLLRSAHSTRRVPFTSFYTGYRQSVLRADELIVAIEIAAPEGKQWFRKVGTRAAQAISKLVMAGIRSPSPRISLGSVAATTIRLPRTEAVLAGGASIDEAASVLSAEITPIDDIRSTADYRRKVASNLLRRFWEDTA